MKYSIILFLFIFNIHFSWANYGFKEEDHENNFLAGFNCKNCNISAKGKLNEQNKKVGVWKYTYDNGNLCAKGKFNNDKMIGTWKFYYYSSKKNYRIVEFDTINRTEDVKIYYQNGQLKEKKIIKLDKLNLPVKIGKYESYYDSGRIIAKGPYEYGKKHGIWQEGWSFTDRIIEREYNHDQPIGVIKRFDSKGNIFQIDSINGTVVKYFENGDIKSIKTRKSKEYREKKFYKNGDLKMIKYTNAEEK
ncbi:MAG: hypothetical protein GY827_09505 [Cytophagales bacterium]|nr:hypothetical protein [Cytophagales bacterium]